MPGKKKHFKSPKQKAFTSPGSLFYVGNEVTGPTNIKLIEYNKDSIEQKNIKTISELRQSPNDQKVFWLDVDGVHEPAVIEQVGKKFGLHPLMLEDILNTTQKPKIEFFEDENQIFVVVKAIKLDTVKWEADIEQASFVLGKDFLISFQEKDSLNVFDQIQERLYRENSRTRKNKADYLLYVLLDLVVDNYYVILDQLGEKLEDLEDCVMNDPQTKYQQDLYRLKREMSVIRKCIAPLRDIISALIREESTIMDRTTNVFLRDVQDHVIQTIETLDSYREIAENIMSSYHALLSNRMNSVMKTLTVFTVIFMPLTFIAGIYGMNFDNMPELRWPNGYFYTLGFMVVLTIFLWFYFKWKKYI